MTSRLLRRVIALERATGDSTWLVMECEHQPTEEQERMLIQAHAEGRMSLLFINFGGCIWLPRFDIPWKTG